jgi:CBS domain-containing protein/sporulation protein YlmC with PRC-barrel domain
MAFVSELIGRPVTDIDGHIVGHLKDLVARSWHELIHPSIEAVVVKDGKTTRLFPISAVAVLLAPSIPLKYTLDSMPYYEPGSKDIYLIKDVLDKQIIDMDGARVVRVNDLELVRVSDRFLVSNVDVGGLGLLRRVGLAKSAKQLASRLNFSIPESYISWDDMELLSYEQGMRLRVPREKIAELHPADIAEILADLNRVESEQLLESLHLNLEQLADTLEEVEPEFQASLVKMMPDEQVADVLEEMGPDAAADLLAELSPERSEDLLNLMEKEDADDVRKLLTYDEDSAGGIMTTEFASVKPEMNPAQVMEYLRANREQAETIFYIYVTDEHNKLLGVISLSALIFAQPDLPVSSFMKTNVISCLLSDTQDEVAQLVSKYDLLALPVIDEENVLHGIVTADDALDKVIPTAWKKRLPRFFR